MSSSQLYQYRAGFGIIAGLIGGILMYPLFVQICTNISDQFMMAMNMQPTMMPGPSPIIVAMGMSVVPGADMNTAANAATVMHFVTAIVIGLVFALVTAALYKPQGARKFLGATNIGSGLAVGILYGAIVWLVFFLPLLMFSFLPNLAVLTAMDLKQPAPMVLTDMMNAVGMLAMELTLASHLFYGAVIGAVVGGLTQWKKSKLLPQPSTA